MEEKLRQNKYEGTELALFAHATNWKAYFCSRIQKYVGKDVLEVGAGIGGTTKILFKPHVRRWVCLEPDPDMAAGLEEDIASGTLPDVCKAVNDILPSPSLAQASFDTVLYIDVLEHIKQDKEELEHAAGYLKDGGHLIVLSPAHNWLFSPFDKSVGHYRRYSRKSITPLTPASVRIVRIEYLDCIGLGASLANRILLRQGMPNRNQIAFWDKILVTLSKRVDPFLGHRLGKSIVAIWEKTSTK